jgi:hypothetical protein
MSELPAARRKLRRGDEGFMKGGLDQVFWGVGDPRGGIYV